MCRGGGKGGEGRCIKDPEFYFEHVNFMQPICCPVETAVGLLDADTRCCTGWLKAQSLEPECLDPNPKATLESEFHCLGLLM